jgi:cytochrome P450 family 2 subfamily J
LTSNLQDNNIRASLSNFIPIVARIAPKLSGYEKLLADIFPILEFLRKPIEQHKATFQPGQPRDFIDVYLEEMRNSKDPNSSFYKEKGEQSILFSVFDLFLAGAETTSTTLQWTFLYLAIFFEVQKKLQAEIMKVVGNSRLPCLSDRPNMPYTEAVIHEVLRYSSFVPLGVVHNTNKEVQIGGYTIPKNTMVFANQYAVHFDEEAWGDPENFRPERFLNKEGVFTKHDSFIAFSVGKRVCLGETLARDELFLFTASLFQAFDIFPAGSLEELKLAMEAKPAGVLSPRAHNLILKERN